MKKIIIIVLAILVVVGVCACSGATTQKEINNTIDNNEIVVDTKRATEDINLDDPQDKYNDLVDIEEKTEGVNYDKISAYMKEECKNTFSPYYELLDFQISDYQEEVVSEKVEAVFLYKVIHKNYDKDPDTVGYIKEAKAQGDRHYQQLYDEYLQPKEMNFQFKVVIDKNDLITLYTNSSPKGIEWEEVKMSDYIISE
jgi:uncharacterized protein YxeA